MSYAEAQYIVDELAGRMDEAAENLDATAAKLAAGIPPQDMQLFDVTIGDGKIKI